jgi:DNA (cytosine-5)-methyltransferase 1
MRDLWILDAYCGAGGCTKGYQRNGFKVLGVDLNDQPNYCGDEFIQDDALHYLRHMPAGRFVAIHASPPCQAYTTLRTLQGDREYPDLVGPTRELLQATGLPYVIENVVGAPLNNPVMLCGSSFGLRIRRHRLFECGGFHAMSLPCAHYWQQDKVFPALNGQDRKRGGRSGIVGVYGNGGDKRADLWAQEMGIDWMSRQELTQAIPPAMTEHIGMYLMDEVLRRDRRAA